MYFLRPLIQWKVLTKEKLFQKSNYKGTYKSFHKIVKNLERKGIINGYRDFFSRKRYIYATELGNDLLLKGGSFSPNHHNLFHDAKMAEIIQQARHFEDFQSFKLEHEIRKFSYSDYDKDCYPDALLVKNKGDDQVFDIAIELEITQKSKPRICRKYNNFINSRKYDVAAYFFSDESVWKRYIDVYKTEFEKEHPAKIIFYYCPSIMSGSLNIDDCKYYYGKDYGEGIYRLLGKRLLEVTEETKG